MRYLFLLLWRGDCFYRIFKFWKHRWVKFPLLKLLIMRKVIPEFHVDITETIRKYMSKHSYISTKSDETRTKMDAKNELVYVLSYFLPLLTLLHEPKSHVINSKLLSFLTLLD